MKRVLSIIVATATLGAAGQTPTTSLTYEGTSGPGRGHHIVFLAGDEEYRSEESLPMLAKLLAERHGFTTTVVFSVDPDGTINPNNQGSISDSSPIDRAELLVMALRFRHWPDADMARFASRLRAGVPIVALRTSTHAFNGFSAESPWASWNYNNAGGFGRRVLGETWVNHWGKHKAEATRGVVEPGAERSPLLRGVSDLFGDTDVYEGYPPADATILVRGLVLTTMAPDAPPADYRKARSTDKQEQPVNDPAMPIVWTRLNRNDNGTTNRVFVSTLGAATDFQNEGLRRLVVNAVYWGLSLDVPARADVRVVAPYAPSAYGFDGFRKGMKIGDLR